MGLKIFTRWSIFSILSITFLRSALFGDIGLNKYFKLRNEIKIENTKIIKLKNKNKKLEKKINAWSKDNFELERMAREDLQMGNMGEKVFLIRS